jgi:hypothetical protein
LVIGTIEKFINEQTQPASSVARGNDDVAISYQTPDNLAASNGDNGAGLSYGVHFSLSSADAIDDAAAAGVDDDTDIETPGAGVADNGVIIAAYAIVWLRIVAINNIPLIIRYFILLSILCINFITNEIRNEKK